MDPFHENQFLYYNTTVILCFWFVSFIFIYADFPFALQPDLNYYYIIIFEMTKKNLSKTTYVGTYQISSGQGSTYLGRYIECGKMSTGFSWILRAYLFSDNNTRMDEKYIILWYYYLLYYKISDNNRDKIDIT